MYEFLNNLLTEMDQETLTVLVGALALFLATLISALRGMKKGVPTQGAVAETMKHLSQVSCGAPKLRTDLISLRHKNHEAMAAISRLQADVDRMAEKVTLIEDRTRRANSSQG